MVYTDAWPSRIYDPFPTFKYEGPLRPVYPLSPRREVPKEIGRPDYSETGTLKRELGNTNCNLLPGIPKSEFMEARHQIKVLNAEEIEGMRKACRVSRPVFVPFDSQTYSADYP